MLVMKFGGSSVAGAAAMERVAGIVAERAARRPVVVLSAMGKTTDRLLRCAQLASQRNFREAQELLHALRREHQEAAEACAGAAPGSPLASRLQGCFEELEDVLRALSALGESSPRSLDMLASYGERLSTLIFSGALQRRGAAAELLDSRRLVRTDSQFTRAVPDFAATEKLLRAAVPPLCAQGRIPVLQGFIGADASGVTTTLGRNGSDYSAAIVGGLLEAEEIQIWTDVPGIMTADPTLVPHARKICFISFAEASELAYFGAKVLHPSTILPAVQRSIPVCVLNSRDPAGTGTRITAAGRAGRDPIKSIACKEGIVTVNVTSDRMLMAHGFLKKLFDIFERHRRPVDMVSTSEVSVSLTLDSDAGLEPLLADLSGIGEVAAARGKAIICLVGDNLKFTPGIAARAFRALESVNIWMISQGASRINLGFVIDQDRLAEAVGRLHREFFSDPDPEIFQ